MTQGMVALWLVWLGMPSALVFLALTGLFPPPFSVVTPANLFFAFLETELFLVLIVLPLFQPILFKARGGTTADEREDRFEWMPFLQIVTLTALGAPLWAICSIVSGIGLETIVKALVLLTTSSAAVLAVGHYASRTWGRMAPIYYVIVFTLSVGLPFLYYLALEYKGKALEEMAYFSPFWGTIHVVGNGRFAHLWIAQSSAALTIVALFLFLGRRKSAKAQLT